MGRPRSFLYVTVDFINTVPSGYTKFVEQHEIKSNTRENDATKRRGKQDV